MRKQLSYLIVSCCFLFGMGMQAYAAQEPQANNATQGTITVRGTVVETDGEPIIGASVTEKGQKTGVSTDINGNFTITVKQGATLEFSFIGCKTVQQKAAPTMHVVLEPSSEALDNIVVVGYGTQRRENLTGAVATVDVDKALVGRQIPDVGRGLQGTTAGLNITLPDSEVGSDPTIRIRGQIGSFQGGASPLILLDNVEIPSIQVVNPDDIESISILKDAASASIYGAKAAFGVILITSKKGATTDRVDVSYSGNFAWSNVSKDIEMATIDGSQYRLDALHAAKGTVVGAFWYITDEAVALQREWLDKWSGKVGKDDPFTYGRDWVVDANNRKLFLRPYDPYEYYIREWAPTMKHNASVTGKAGKTQYTISLGYLAQDGLNKAAKVDQFHRYNIAARLSTEVNKYLSVRAGLQYSLRNKEYSYATSSTTADAWYYLYRWDHYQPFGVDERGYGIRSPYWELQNSNTASRQNSYMNANFGLTLNFTENWHFNLDYTFAKEDLSIFRPGTKFTAGDTWAAGVARYDDNGNRVYVNKAGQVVSQSDPEAMPAYYLNYYQYTSNGSNPDHIYRSITNDKRHTLNMTMDYDWKINENNQLKAMIGMNRADWDSENHWAQITNLSDILRPSFDKTTGTQTSSGNLYWEGQLGFFGRINYALFDRYLLEANVRYDASSKFPVGMKWRAFPSFSLGWRLDQEAWMKWAQPALSQFKIRGSWGSIGDQSVSSSLYVATISQATGTWITPSGDKAVYVGTPAAVAGDITWQDIQTADVGIDARFFNNRLGVAFDWYQRDTKNMLVPGEGIPVTFGAGAPTGNYGNLRTRGWELTLDYNHQFNKDLSVNATVTLSDALTHITKYGSSQVITSNYNGKEYGEIWGYVVDRLYQKDDFVYDAAGNHVTVWALDGKEVPEGTTGAKQMNKLSDPNGIYEDYFQSGSILIGPGDVKYKDIDGDGRIHPNTSMLDDHGDRVKIGNSTPRYEYGVRLGVNYRGFDFSIFGQGIGKRKIWGEGPLVTPGWNTGDGAMPQAIASDYWTEEHTDAFYPRALNAAGSSTVMTYQVSDRYLLNLAYFRIKNITLGYTLPSELTRKALINRLRVYVAAENIATFDKLHGLPIDPEVKSGVSMWNSSNYNSGRTGVGTPAMMNFNVGIQLNF
ncbi:MAG: TonB-dependent receptor [Muribaculaceae bacterium]|nr:TonB-dependent receptor [Muribaculaceae bacterium]